MQLFIVEDSPVLRPRLTAWLEAMDGVEVIATAADVPGAMACFALWAMQGGKPDVVVLDLSLFGISMADANGLDLLEYIKRRLSPIKVIILTNYASASLRRRCARAGADYFLDKSHDLEQLRHIVASLGGAVAAPDVHIPLPLSRPRPRVAALAS